jgi:tripartite-type tricarboxylate transporter receptor subunit TctC
MPSHDMAARARALLRLLLATGLVLLAVPVAANERALAQSYPSRTVKIIVPYPAGGTADALPRILADWLSKKWGQSVIIENITGAGGNIGAAAGYNSQADGYTLVASPPGPFAINQHLYAKLNFEPAKFEPVVIMAQVPNALLVNPSKIKANTVAEFIDYLKANPMKLNAATQGNGTTSHLTLAMLEMMAHVKAQAIPYRGSAPALQALIAGTVDFMFDNLGVSMSLVRAGKLKLIAVASAKRVASLPDVPALAETLPGFQSVTWYAVAAPPNTPASIVQKLNTDIDEALRQPDIVARFKKLSAEPIGGSVDETKRFINAEVDRWYKVIKAANVKLQ